MTTLILLMLMVFGPQEDGKSYTLRQQWLPGHKWHNTISQNYGTSVKGRPGEESMHIAIVSSHEVEQVKPDGNVDIIMKFHSFGIDLNGQKSEMPGFMSALYEVPIRMVWDNDGQMVKMTPPDDLPPASAQVLEQMEQVLASMRQELPKDSVRIGDTWQKEIPTTMEMMGREIQMVLKNNYTFEGLGVVDGQPCYILNVTGEGDLFINQGEGGSGKVRVSGQTLLARDTCHALKSKMNTITDVKIPKADGVELEARVSMEMNIDTKQVSMR